MKVFAETSRAH